MTDCRPIVLSALSDFSNTDRRAVLSDWLEDQCDPRASTLRWWACKARDELAQSKSQEMPANLYRFGSFPSIVNRLAAVSCLHRMSLTKPHRLEDVPWQHQWSKRRFEDLANRCLAVAELGTFGLTWPGDSNECLDELGELDRITETWPNIERAGSEGMATYRLQWNVGALQLLLLGAMPSRLSLCPMINAIARSSGKWSSPDAEVVEACNGVLESPVWDSIPRVDF